jgi:hypothetical protein
MKQHVTGLPLAIVIVCLVCIATGCKSGRNATANQNANSRGSSASGKITEVYTARDENGAPGQRTETFGIGDRTIHSVARLKEPAPGTKIKFSWWVVKASGAENDNVRDVEYTTKDKEDVVHSHVTLPSDWPPGKYKVDVYVNDVLDKTVNFSVE